MIVICAEVLLSSSTVFSETLRSKLFDTQPVAAATTCLNSELLPQNISIARPIRQDSHRESFPTTPLKGLTLRLDCSLQPEIGIAAKFLDSLGVGIVLSDAHSGGVHFINRHAAELLGYSPEEMVARKLSFLDLTHPDDRERAAADHQRLVVGKIDRCCLDRRYLRRGGDVVWANVSVALFDDLNGAVRWRAAVVQETPTATILQQQRAFAQKLAGMVSWSWAVKSDELIVSGGIAFVSVASEDSAFDGARNASDTFNKHFQQVHADDQRVVETIIKRAFGSGHAFSIEYRVINSIGEIRHLRGSATCLVDEAGEVTHLVGATIDITYAKSRRTTKQLPGSIRDILKHIEVNWNKPIYLDDLARSYGIAPRAMQRHFASQGLMPLTRYVKELRLRHAHQQLSNPKPATSVTAVALYCGFQNLGQFSRDYRQQFGELPSETLKSAWLSCKGS